MLHVALPDFQGSVGGSYAKGGLVLYQEGGFRYYVGDRLRKLRRNVVDTITFMVEV